ncbi:MAG: MBL fold metallo-hydrolase, partial [Candidatus Pacebacteria bacterium]|nr:MBL fold metallo-hydrolase [Candidatus Paceibacterota bacterium]
YGENKVLLPGIRAKAINSGHILGSSSFEIFVSEGKAEKRLVFSSDLGNSPSNILPDMQYPEGGDAVFIESTYGNELHEPKENGRQKLKDIIKSVISRQAVLLIPVFAIERTQELLWELNQWIKKGDIPAIPVFLDSPLAVKVTDVYRKYAKEYFNPEAKKFFTDSGDPFSFEGLDSSSRPKEAKKISKVNPPKIILAGSGMSDGGRIGGYISEYGRDPKNEILIISYQAEGTLGRRMLEQKKELHIGKKKIRLRAKVSSIFSFSSHADRQKLLQWVEKINSPRPKRFFVIHGEEASSLSLAEALKQKTGADCTVPECGKEYEIA